MQNKKIDLINNLTDQQNHEVRKLCMEKGLTFLQALKIKYPILYYP